MEQLSPMERAVKEGGGTQAALADRIGRRQSTISEWVRRGWPSTDACLAIEQATGGKVKAVELLEHAARKSSEAA